MGGQQKEKKSNNNQSTSGDDLTKKIDEAGLTTEYEFLNSLAAKDQVCLGIKRGLMGDLTGTYIWMLIPTSQPRNKQTKQHNSPRSIQHPRQLRRKQRPNQKTKTQKYKKKHTKTASKNKKQAQLEQPTFSKQLEEKNTRKPKMRIYPKNLRVSSRTSIDP